MTGKRLVVCLALSCAMILSIGKADASRSSSEGVNVTVLTSGLDFPIGSTIGPDGALYVAEGPAGRISRVNPETGEVTTFASGLPKAIISVGGPMDIAFIGKTAYVLVTLVDPDVGGNNVDGIYRVDGPDSFTVVADIGSFNVLNPPTIPFAIEVPTGLQFALQPYHGGFLVTDGHLNRVLQVTSKGEISVLIAFDDIVPTGLTLSGDTVYMAEAGPVPEVPENGKVVSFRTKAPTTATVVASGAPLLVGVQFGRGHRLYALSQGPGVPGAPPGSPAQPNSGSLVEVNEDGTFTVITDGLDLPASFQFIGDTAYIVTLTGDILKIDNVPK
jgi:hypothetical protein